jgi:hypothetical protein
VKEYLLKRVTLLRIHRFDPNDVQFADALVSSAVVFLRKTPQTPRRALSSPMGAGLSIPE